MLLMNKFIRIYSHLPYIIFLLMFRLLLVNEDRRQLYAECSSGHNANNSIVDARNPESVDNRVDENAVVNDDNDSEKAAEIFVAIVYHKSKEAQYSRAIKQTVASISDAFTSATKLKVTPLYTAIGEPDGGYSVRDIETVCATWNHKPVVAALVFGSFKSSFGHVLTSLHNNIPVLWATGEVQPGYFERVPLSRFEVRLDPGSYEVLRSLRSLLLATHWHSFTIMHTTTLLASNVYKEIISQPPLLPTILQFRSDSTSYYIFRLLSDVSKSTKGVIVLICEGVDAKRVIEESKKLNMINGDFVWLWIDTGAALLNDRSIKLEKMIGKETTMAAELRKVRHAPNFYVNESRTNAVAAAAVAATATTTTTSTTKFSTTSSPSSASLFAANLRSVVKKREFRRIRDNNAASLRAGTRINGTHAGGTSGDRTYQNKTEYRKSLHNRDQRYNDNNFNVICSADNGILPNRNKNASSAAPAAQSSSSPATAALSSSVNALVKRHFSLYGFGRKRAWRMNRNELTAVAKMSNETAAATTTAAGTIGRNKESFVSVINGGGNGRGNNERASSKRGKRKRNGNEVSAAVAAAAATAATANKPTKNRRRTTGDADVEAAMAESGPFAVPVFVENTTTPTLKNKTVPEMPVGILALQLMPPKVDKWYVESSVKLLIATLRDVIVRYGQTRRQSKFFDLPRISCFDFMPILHDQNSIMEELTQSLKQSVREALAGRTRSVNGSHFDESTNSSLAAKFKILNLVPEENILHNKSGLHLGKKKANSTTPESRKWRTIGSMTGEENVHLETIVWPGGDIIPVSTGRGSRSIFRIVTAFAPPFVMIGELDEDGQCLRGIECHQFLTSDKDNLTLLFNEMERTEEEIEVNVLDRIQAAEKSKHIWDGVDDIRNHHFGQKFKASCCYGLSMDLLENVAEELEFDFQLYIVADGLFGSRTFAENGEIRWNGIVGDLISGAAHMSFSALSVSSSRAQFIDFSVPYFFSGVTFLASPKESTDIPLFAFLLPFSPNLWIAIFTSLHLTAIAVAIYEWLSPFGLNPWGRQRSKNFGMASALWVMWSLYCGHLVQFKAPKSWPNKFLINVWGGFSVIFIASYTANIAALIAGLFFHTTVANVGDHYDKSLLSQRVGAPKSSAAEYYIRSTNQILWDHMQRYSVLSVEDGVQLLKNGSLDLLISDTPILDYYRATDHGCKLQKVGDTINEDTYAIGMMKGFPLKDSISAVIAKYSTNGYIDILQEKWYGGLPCFKLATDMAQPRPLGVAAVAGVFLMLGLGVLIGCLILLSEHLFYKYTLPSLRKKPKSSIWKSRNVMFFSQKLYRFINCVELVSPHHAARELVHTLRQGQITSLFQKSVRRKEHEQRQQQQKSKAQFFEMIQEIRRVQQEGRKHSHRVDDGKQSPKKKYSKNQQILLSPTGLLKYRNRLSPGRLNFARRLSKDVFRSKSSGNLNVTRLGSDINVATGRFFDFYDAQAIGRRLSHGTGADNSPPAVQTRRGSQFFERSPSSSDVMPDSVSVAASSIVGVTADAAAKTGSSPPKTTNPASRSPSVSVAVSPSVFSPRRSSASLFSRDIGPVAARKFSNVDTSSFRGVKSKQTGNAAKMGAPRLTLNNEEFTCDGGHCEQQTSSFPGRNNSVKSNEHIIEIVIPSSESASPERESSGYEFRDEQLATTSSPTLIARRHSSAYPASDRCDASEDDELKPKILLHFPKKKKNARTQCYDTANVVDGRRSASTVDTVADLSPLARLSADELQRLARLSEKELKNSLLKVLKEKSPT